MAEQPKTKGTKQLFENPLLERLSRTHISIPLIIFTLYAAGLLYWSYDHQYLTFVETVLVFLLGLLAFTLVEYVMHRFLFHLTPRTEFRKKLSYKIHGVHHEFPKDKDRLAMPPVVSIFLSTAFLFLYKLLMGNVAFAFTAGFFLGYAGYLFVHYMVHAYKAPKNFWKVLWVHHGIHHYKSPDRAFGVSSPLWDHIFRTMPN